MSDIRRTFGNRHVIASKAVAQSEIARSTSWAALDMSRNSPGWSDGFVVLIVKQSGTDLTPKVAKRRFSEKVG